VENRLECSALTLGNVLKVSVKYYLGFVGNLMLFLMVKEFKKSVKILLKLPLWFWCLPFYWNTM